jgi:hypothetical protein
MLGDYIRCSCILVAWVCKRINVSQFEFTGKQSVEFIYFSPHTYLYFKWRKLALFGWTIFIERWDESLINFYRCLLFDRFCTVSISLKIHTKWSKLNFHHLCSSFSLMFTQHWAREVLTTKVVSFHDFRSDQTVTLSFCIGHFIRWLFCTQSFCSIWSFCPLVFCPPAISSPFRPSHHKDKLYYDTWSFIFDFHVLSTIQG